MTLLLICVYEEKKYNFKLIKVVGTEKFIILLPQFGGDKQIDIEDFWVNTNYKNITHVTELIFIVYFKVVT